MVPVKVINGSADGSNYRVAIVASRFNEFFVKRLMDGCISTLEAAGLEPDAVTIVWVPGAFEIPLAAKAQALAGGTDAIIALGAVIRGETTHFEYVAGECARGVAAVGLETGVPVIFGVLTVDDSRHALERSGDDGNNKGSEAARAALEMISVLRQVRV